MKPALSIVVFTILSGAGLGLAAVLAAAAVFDIGAAADDVFWLCLALSVLLTGGGLLASVGHLANPKNAWRAIMRIRTSWLSREAALAVVFFILAALWALQKYQQSEGALLPLAVLLSALSAVYCTAMIYQSLKPIAAWHHPLTSFCYLSIALYSGAALFAAAAQSTMAAVCVLLFGAMAATGKGMHYRRLGSVRDIRVGRAAGFSRAKAKLLETGHSEQTFLTREFMFSASAAMIGRMRVLSMLLSFAPPFVGALLLLFSQSALLAVMALPFMFAGLLGERWLFFAEARHSIRAYHGDGKP